MLLVAERDRTGCRAKLRFNIIIRKFVPFNLHNWFDVTRPPKLLQQEQHTKEMVCLVGLLDWMSIPKSSRNACNKLFALNTNTRLRVLHWSHSLLLLVDVWKLLFPARGSRRSAWATWLNIVIMNLKLLLLLRSGAEWRRKHNYDAGQLIWGAGRQEKQLLQFCIAATTAQC